MNVNQEQFLWPEEKNLYTTLSNYKSSYLPGQKIRKENFCQNYFDLVVIPTVEHIPWSLKNILIPSGIFSHVVEIVK